MTDAQLIAYINQWIVTNHNNEITAAVLNPVLQAIRQRLADVAGDPNNLATTDKSNLVAAINEVFNLIGSGAPGVRLYTGTADPNVTPPTTFSPADFYLLVDVDNNPSQLYQFDGFNWVTSGKTYIEDGVGTTVSGEGTQLDPYKIDVAGAVKPASQVILIGKGFNNSVANVLSTAQPGDHFYYAVDKDLIIYDMMYLGDLNGEGATADGYPDNFEVLSSSGLTNVNV